MKYENLTKEILTYVGGKENVKEVTHCMTRLRFILIDIDKADQAALKALDDVMGVVYKGGQLQLIIGPTVTNLYDEVNKHVSVQEAVKETVIQPDKGKLSVKGILNNVMGALAGCVTPLIPILLCAGLSKTIVAIFGPQLLNVLTEQDSLYILFTFVGDAGFYFLPVIVGYTASKRFGCNPIMGLFMGAILVHPKMVEMAMSGASFDVYGIPSMPQNYASTIIPIILTIWAMSYVENFFKKYVPDVLKVFGVPFLTLLVMLPLELCLFGPLGAYLGQYVCQGIIGLYDLAGPLALGIVGATFGLLVLTGMHNVLLAFLFTTFPMMGYDAFIMPAIMACSWAGAGVTLACIVKFKSKKMKSLVSGYFITWLFGGVGEPTLYGLNLTYKTSLYASIISGFIAGVATGFLGLKAYVLNPTNGIYGLAAFLGGPSSNYYILGASLVISVVTGFVVMWFMKLDEGKE